MNLDACSYGRAVPNDRNTTEGQSPRVSLVTPVPFLLEGSVSFALPSTVASPFGNVLCLFVAEFCSLRREARLLTLATKKTMLD